MTSKFSIGIHGDIGSGKDTAADFLCGTLQALKYSFADPLRQIAAILCNDYEYNFIDRASKEEVLADIGLTRREILKVLGTDCVQLHFGKSIWIKNLERRLECTTESIVVVPDVRFKPEADWVRSNGILLHLVRPENPYASAMSNHPSDAGVPYEAGDVEVVNSGDKFELYDKLMFFIGNVKPLRARLNTL